MRKNVSVENAKVFKENKYIVIKRKDLEDLWYRVTLPTFSSGDRGDTYTSSETKKQLCNDLEALNRLLEGDLGNSNKYIICNQDESYAELVWQVILGGEALKRCK